MANPTQLRKIMPSLPADKAEQFAPFLDAARTRFAIDTLLREAAFLAQLAHESGEFKWMKEIWGPSKWQKEYEGAASLGNTQPGDGKRFMGRGPIQLTGRANYARCSQGLGLGTTLLERPELLESAQYGCLAAAWFWNSRGLNAPADQRDFHRVTQLINGRAELGYAERFAYYQRALQVLAASYAGGSAATATPAPNAQEGPQCRIVVDGEDMTKDLDPFIKDGRVLLRVRPLADRTGLRLIDVESDSVTVEDAGGTAKTMAMTIVDDAGYVALRDLPMDFCQWDDATRTATISLVDRPSF